MSRYLFGLVISLSSLFSSYAIANETFGGYLSGNASVGQFGSPSAALEDRFVALGGVDSLLGVNFRGITFGLHLEYDILGQVTPLSQTSRTNSKGTISSLGIGMRYFWNDDYYFAILIDMASNYVFSEKTIGAENDKVNSPVALRVKVGKKLDWPYLVTLDGIFNYSSYRNFHIGGRDYDWDSKLWSVGMALTWHFGKAPVYVPTMEHEKSVVVAAPESGATSNSTSVDKDISKDIAKSDSSVMAPGETSRERISSKYIFSPNRYRIDARMITELRPIVSRMKSNPHVRAEIEGYSDTSGEEKLNTFLSKARAESVRKYLIEKKIESRRIKAIGMGDQNPVATNETKTGRANNRRYEIILINEGGEQ